VTCYQDAQQRDSGQNPGLSPPPQLFRGVFQVFLPLLLGFCASERVRSWIFPVCFSQLFSHAQACDWIDFLVGLFSIHGTFEVLEFRTVRVLPVKCLR